PSRLESRARARGEQQDDNPQPAETRDTGNEERGRTERPGPAAQEDRSGTDLPGTPGQPSRLESWARAREVQQDTTQDDQTTGGREDESTSARIASGTENREAASGPELPGRDEGDREIPEDDGTVQEDGPSTGAATGETERSQDQEAEPFPPPDRPEPGATDRPHPEQDQSAAEQTARAPDQPSTEPQEDRPDTTPGHVSDREAPPGQDTEQLPQVSDAPGDNTPTPPENRPGDGPQDGETTETPEPRADGEATAGDRDRKSEDDGTEPPPDEPGETNPEAPANPILSDVYTDSQGRVRIEPRYGREQTGESNEAETSAPSPDPTGENPRRTEAEVGTRGRGEFGSPETDPADRDPRERDPERSSRRKELLREAAQSSTDIVKSVDKAIDGAFKALDAKAPSGHPSTARDTGPSIESVHTPVKVGSVAFGVLGAAIMVTRIGQWTAGRVREMRGHHRASNR
ncbi:hypothetical protein, partial [Actinomadura sp. KC216]|uniref:hypothetical protein n=1 Tax=Actinomadura sp. KC216 TaxID=2530370 RepID=UPI00140432B9